MRRVRDFSVQIESGQPGADLDSIVFSLLCCEMKVTLFDAFSVCAVLSASSLDFLEKELLLDALRPDHPLKGGPGTWDLIPHI